MRELRFEIASARMTQSLDRGALFATVLGETHTLGITMAADLFRDHGRRNDLRTGLDHDALIDTVADRPYAIIGLSANHPDMLGDLIRLIIALRITHPLAHILVSGQIVQQVPHLNAVIRADCVIGNAMDAMKVLEDFSDQA